MNDAIKYDSGKPRLELIPPSYWWLGGDEASYEVAAWFYEDSEFPEVPDGGGNPLRVLEFGSHKYGDYNWIKGMKWSRLYGAFLRHRNKFDEESNIWVPRS